MDFTTFMVMYASPLVLAGSIAAVFIWAAKGKTPDWVKSDRAD